MKVKMKQNKYSSSIRISSFVLALFVLFISISVPVFAYTDTSINDVDFTEQPIPVASGFTVSAMYNSGMPVGASGSASVHVVSNSNDHVYCFAISPNPSATNIVCVSVDSFTATLTKNTSPMDYASLNSTSYTYNSRQLYYMNNTSFGTYTDLIPIFSSLNDGFSAFFDWLDNPPPVVAPHSLNTTLPAGNAIIINVSGNNAEALSLSSTSALRHKDNWSDGNQMMGYFSSAPTSLSSPFEGTHSITWRGVGSPNLFGGYNTWNTTAPLLPTGNYLVIVNPAYPNDNPDSITSNQASNGAITISCGYCLSAQIVPLSSSWSNGSIVSTSGELRLDGEYDPSTDSWTFNNSVTGQPQNPVAGGLTDVDAEHITINDWLQNISHQIGSFFAGAIGAVSTLVSSGSDFIHSLSGLYAWLPAPVYSVLVSALILVITIGVIKVFI